MYCAENVVYSQKDYYEAIHNCGIGMHMPAGLLQ